MKNKFYTFSQNNSGGYFVTDKEAGVCEHVIIEAPSHSSAHSKLLLIGEKVNGFDDYCSCCGERWSSWGRDEEGTASPEIYGTKIENKKKEMFLKNCSVHYADGTFKWVDFQ
jgi:hypothetical protein